MARRHALVISLLLGFAAAAAALALVRLTQTSSAAGASAVSRAQLAQRRHALDRVELSLRRALARRAPKLPALPRYGSTATAAPAPSAAPPRIEYVRPAPVVVVRHHSHGDDGHESDGGGGDD